VLNHWVVIIVRNKVIGVMGVDEKTCQRLEHRFPYVQVVELPDGVFPHRLSVLIVNADRIDLRPPEIRSNLQRVGISPPIVTCSLDRKIRESWASHDGFIALLPGVVMSWLTEHQF